MIKREYSNGVILEIFTDKLMAIQSWDIEMNFGADAPTMHIVCSNTSEDEFIEQGTELKFKLTYSDGTSNNFTGYVYAVAVGDSLVYDLLLRSKNYFTIGREDSFGSIKNALSTFEKVDSNTIPVTSGKLNMFSETPFAFVNRIAPCYNKNVVYGRGLAEMVFRDVSSMCDVALDFNTWAIQGSYSAEYNKHDATITRAKVGEWEDLNAPSGVSLVSHKDYGNMCEAVIHNHKFDVASKTVFVGSHKVMHISPGMLIDLSGMNYMNSAVYPKKGFVATAKIAAEGVGCESSLEIHEI